MGSSAQNRSGVHWCRRWVKFTEVPDKVPKKFPGGFGAEPGQVQQGSEEGLGSFGAKPGQVQQVSREGSIVG